MTEPPLADAEMPPAADAAGPSRVDAILDTLSKLVQFDIRNLYDEYSSLLPVAAWPPEAALAVAGITSRELFVGHGPGRRLVGVEHKVRFADRSKSLELSMRQLGLFDPGRAPEDSRAASEMTDGELEALAADGARLEESRWQLMTAPELDAEYNRVRQLYENYRPRAAKLDELPSLPAGTMATASASAPPPEDEPADEPAVIEMDRAQDDPAPDRIVVPLRPARPINSSRNRPAATLGFPRERAAIARLMGGTAGKWA